ncbi:uncharacterized protein LOC107736540 isoform X1 [Sinocyclocheilus rhinocerous]|uniref:uncharacterized protein LOC107736540 isoform X1 n=1 Tax=Sinocyclocheilus rhinocerous TaxID=307959 RepID=UPI0007B9EDF4|nr:PREDICTED: uncharacterized protein LOC107736540 isoform X1 [Sinocyclocheilus rhinocerous]XP_016403422.1 PREDICTED: uncharacterized protein LOC107736540 isoform X1 [Sinocyclocheilus rhinocerous]
MKSHEGELEREISKVQGMVCELRAGFSRALLELNQIQQGDTELQSQLEDTRHGCNKRSLHLESLVLSLKEELEEVRCQFRQLCEAQERKPPENPGRENVSADVCMCECSNGVDDRSGQSNGAAEALPLSSVGGDFLIHCYLQGLQVWQWAKQNSGGDSLSRHVAHSCLRRGRRRGVVEMLLQSERDYVSCLNQLYEKYKSAEQNVAFVKHIDQMLQRHLLFRNTLEERLTTDERSCAAGDAFLNLTGQNNKSFSDAYLGYVASLGTVLRTEISTSLPHSNPQNAQEEKESFRLLSLLFAPVSRIHKYLNIIQALLRSSGAGHADWCSLQESEQVLWDLCTSCHMTLAKTGPCEEGEGPEQGLRSRCCAESPDCGPSAFTKYCANTNADTASVTAGAGIDSTVHQRKCCRVGTSRTLPRPSGILRNGRKHICDLTPGGWTAEYMWNGSAGKSLMGPICVPFARHPREAGRFLNPVPPVGVEGNLTAAAKSQSSSAGLAVRVCGSPGLDGRIYTSDLYPPSHRLDDGDTDCDVADASVFDFSSVTTCSPDETLNQLRGAEACDDEDDDEEDSEVPVLLKPSYTHNASAVQAGGSLCMQWQIPRRAPIPAEVCIGAQGKTRAPKPHRMPTSAFRPIWDPTYSQGDVTPAKENSVSFSSTNQIINQQQETDQSRSAYRGTGVQRAEAVWHDSEDSEGPCSTV